MKTKFKNFIKENNNNFVIGYHGSYGNIDFTRPDKKDGIWFTETLDNEILKYYSTRGDSKLIIKAKLNLGKTLDLSNHDTDTKVTRSTAREFLSDIGINVKRWMTQLYEIDSYSSNYIKHEILNTILRTDDYIHDNYDSIIIKEDSVLTYCILDRKNIEILEIIRD